ncbi:murein hydrolase activator EnvC family protein [Clostridium tarantellae]|nr:peptidoglycan DD-metalloendopeptidase family protein [Clostridium tarantellae]
MKKKVLAFVIGTMLTNIVALTCKMPIYTYANNKDIEIKEKKLEEAEKKLESTKKSRKEIEVETAKLDDKIEDKKVVIKDLTDKTIKLEKDNKNLEEKIDGVQKKINENYEIIKDIVKIEYEQKAGGYLLLLLEAKDFGNFLRRLEVVSSIVKKNDKIITETKSLEKDLQEKKLQLQVQIDEIKEKKKIAEAEEVKLNKLIEDKKVQVNELIKAQQNLEKEIILTKEQIDELDVQSKIISKELDNNSSNNHEDNNNENESMSWPVPGYTTVSSSFGYRVHPITGVNKLHTGVDFPAPAGTPVVAAKSGTIIMSTYNTAYGNIVGIDHGSGLVTFYAHNTERLVSVGQKVKKGQTIATVGTTGYSTGNHCHFEVKKNGQFVDPMKYLR